MQLAYFNSSTRVQHVFALIPLAHNNQSSRLKQGDFLQISSCSKIILRFHPGREHPVDPGPIKIQSCVLKGVSNCETSVMAELDC